MNELHRSRAIPVLVLALIAISSAAVLARSAGVAPIGIAFWRTLMVGALLSPTLALTPPRLQGKDSWLILLAGALLALHFWLWFASLEMTSVLRSTVLVCLTPIWAGLLEGVVLRRPPPRRFWIGVGVALIGAVTMSAGASNQGAALSGDLLAVLAGMLSASYFVVGSVVRPRVSIGPYGALVCLACAGWLLPAAWATQTSLWGFSTQSWLVLMAMALGPQLFGHIGLNYAVRYIPAAIIAASLLLEPVGATLLGMLFLGEYPTRTDIAGGVLILIGLGVVTIPVQKKDE